MKKNIFLLSTLIIIGCKTNNKSDEKSEVSKSSPSKEVATTTDETNNEKDASYLVPSEKEKFPFIIDQKVYDELNDSESQYIAIKDTNVINKLLIPVYKKELISLNNNPDLLTDYTFAKIGERKIKDFKITFFTASYHGDGDFVTTFANVTKEGSNKIIDSKKVCDYHSYLGGDQLMTLVMDKTGKMEVTTIIDKNKPTIKHLIVENNGKIVSKK
ncbi:hypothetical protein [Flavobacterium oreochromis]|uniref:Lipoprotein n=2 Tax=Flavobacterium TaxID=237 RepID=A0A2D0AHS2_9FLAO|nr:hypothetical protein [Flavobacterium oreochromis]OWP75783.1 hypothetical protein BWG23_10020 [Flavobacterium oreochromis]OWP77655.1 hypothetical protein BWK62_06770 [Flavobacterium oreochromis]